MRRNRLGCGAGAVLVAAALSGCGSSQTASEELAPERSTAAVETRAEAPSAPTETPAPATPSAANPETADAPSAPVIAPANTVAAVGPESGDAHEETARPRHRVRRAGAAVNSRTTLPVAEAPAVRETETRWTHPYPVSRAGIRWGGPMGEERPRVIRRQAVTQPPQQAATTAAPAVTAPSTSNDDLSRRPR